MADHAMPAGDGPYANPSAYDSPSLERASLAGRIRVARTQVARYQRSGDAVRVERWQSALDGLLDHYGAADDRAATAAMEPGIGGLAVERSRNWEATP